MTKHDDWLRAANDARSFRQIYALSLEIAEATEDPVLQEAAVAVVRVLKRVVDKPIASSHRLRQAQRYFDRLKFRCAKLQEEETQPAAGPSNERPILRAG